MSAALYLHIPFCVRKCDYCDFYSLPFDEGTAEEYTEALVRAMRGFGTMNAGNAGNAGTVETVYLGGGTPSLLGARRLSALLDEADRHMHIARDGEITVEANPGTVDAALLRDLRAAGCNRLSLGVQSLDDAELQALGRVHTAAEAVEAIRLAAAAGFGRVSADLMLGIPHQTVDSLTHSIDALAALPVDHISAYLLKIEEGTPFAARALRGLPDEELAERLYLTCVERLEAAGFRQYEVSNFARPGGESRHNLNYWRCGEYLGLGPAAHSFLAGRRSYFPRDLQAFLDAPNPLDLAVEDGPGGDAQEQVMLRLRLREGLDTGLLPALGADPRPLLQRAGEYRRHGLCQVERGVVSLTPRGFLLSNTLTAGLLAALDPLD